VARTDGVVQHRVVAEPTNDLRAPTSQNGIGQISDTVQLVKEYARQETLGPLRGAGRWLAAGAAGAILIGVGVAFLALGLLRMLQTEVKWFDGRWASIVPYLAALIVCVLVMAVALARINRKSLEKGPSR
jgi:hypothetical protein